jgi:hypothetical protein
LGDQLRILGDVAALGAHVIHVRTGLLLGGNLEIRAAAGALGDDLADPELHPSRINKGALRRAGSTSAMPNLEPPATSKGMEQG